MDDLEPMIISKNCFQFDIPKTRKCWENDGSDLGLCWVWPRFNLDLYFSHL